MSRAQQDPGPQPRLKVKAPPPGVITLVTQLETVWAPTIYMSSEGHERLIGLQALILDGSRRAYSLGMSMVREARRTARERTYTPYGSSSPGLYASGEQATVTRKRITARRPRLTGMRSRERRPGTTRTTTSKRTRTTSSAQSADPPAADQPSAADIDRGILLLGYWAAHECQDRAFFAALVELTAMLEGDRLTDDDVETFIELRRYNDWPPEDREEFPVWLVENRPDLFTRRRNGRSRLVEPVEFGPWLEPTDDDTVPF